MAHTSTTTIRSKINIIGDRNTGKSSLMNYLLGRENSDENLNSIVSFEEKKIVMDDHILDFFLWDLNEKLSSSTERTEFYAGSLGGLIVFDLTNKDSFDSVSKWIEELMTKAHTDPAVPYIVIGNKVDLKDSRKIKENKARKFIESLNKKLKKKGFNTIIGNAYYEVSTVTGHNIDTAFEHLGRLLIEFWEFALENISFDDW